MNELSKAELKQEKKIKKIMWRCFGAAGIGAGLLIMKLLVAPFIGDNPEIESAIVRFSLCLIGFCAVMVALFIFKRSWVGRAYLAGLWVVLPIILLKLLGDIF